MRLGTPASSPRSSVTLHQRTVSLGRPGQRHSVHSSVALQPRVGGEVGAPLPRTAQVQQLYGKEAEVVEEKKS